MTKADELLFQELQHFRKKQTCYTGYKSRGVYELDKIEDPLGIRPKHSLSSLTLLKVNKIDELNEDDEVLEEEKYLERPLTPINESIRSPPKTYNALCRHVRRRINPRPHWTHISVEDQLSLGAVLLGEVNAVWSGFRKQVDDPFLTPKQNKELQRRITVHIVTVCEQLFLYYCEQVKVLNARGVFSEDANLCRIRGEIATSAGKYLNLLTVRRHIIEDLRKAEQDLMKLGKTTDPITPETPKTPIKLSFHNLIETTRSKKRVPSFNLTQEIRDMKKKMPVLDLNLAYSLIPLSRMQDRLEEIDMVMVEEVNAIEDQYEENVASLRKIRSWASEPLLTTSLLPEAYSDDEEVMESPSLISTSRTKLQSDARFSFHKRRDISSAHLTKSTGRYFQSRLSLHLNDPKEDLKNLMRSHSKIETDIPDEDIGIPPLIQAITRRQDQDAKLRKLKKEGEELDARKQEFEEEERKPLPEPKYPQPPVIQTEIPGHANPVNSSNVTIRAADMHVPDRVELPDIALQMNGPLSNDLTGEISPATVKELDANLFQGEELKEVYLEIMKTVPDDHLVFDNDELVMKPIEKVNLNKTLASSTLTLPKQQRVINPKLKKARTDPPWIGEPQELWERNGKPASMKNVSHGRSTQPSGIPPLYAESHGRALKAHASWLAWWKATINTDDYFKYLSTKDTDFLGVIYHFYDSEISESEEDIESKIELLEETRKREEFIRDVRAKKENFVPGLWNVDVVRLGGLGKYPDQLDNLRDDFESPADDNGDDDDDEQLESENSFANYTRKIALNRLKDGSRLKVNTPADSSDDEESRGSFRIPQINSELPAPSVENFERTGIEKSKKASKTLSFSEEEKSSFEGSIAPLPSTERIDPRIPQINSELPAPSVENFENTGIEKMKKASKTLSFSEEEKSSFEGSIAPLPSTGRVDPNDLVKKALRVSSDSDYQTEYSTLSSTDASKVILSNVQSKQSSGYYTSGYHSLNDNFDILSERGSYSKQQTQPKIGAYLSDPTGRQLSSVYYMREWKHSHGRQKAGAMPNLLKGYYKGSSIKQSESITKASSYGPTASVSGTVTSPRTESPLEGIEIRTSRNLQSRFEIVWRKLRMTTVQKLNAAAKYSSDKFNNMLDKVVSSWERVTDLLQKREKLMRDLQTFEMEASNPHRFFYKGAKGSSTNRLREAKTRAKLYQQLEKVERSLAPMLHSIHEQYDDIVTLEGRPYHEKMNVDKVEMLYWLQQERRALQLDKLGEPEQLKQFIRDNHVTMSDESTPTPRLPLPITNVSIDQKS